MGKRDLLKRGILLLSYSLGYFYRDRGIPIMAYHSIDDTKSPISLSPAVFRKQMEFLKLNNYRCISLKELYHYLISERVTKENLVVLTFDDGFKSNYEAMFPIIEEFGFTATIFLVAGSMNKAMNWRRVAGIPDLQMMSWSESREMKNHNIDFQSHSITHPFLTELSKADAEHEIIYSKNIIEDKLGEKVDFFSYPYGDFDERIVAMLIESGYLGACSASHGKVKTGDSLYSLKRIGSEHISGHDPASKMLFFKGSLLGGAWLYQYIRKSFPGFIRKPVIKRDQ